MKKVLSVCMFTFFTLYTAFAQVDIKEGVKLFTNENFGEATKFFENVAAKDPKSTIAHYYLGKIKYELEDYTGAEASFNKGSSIGKCHECQVGLAQLMLDNNKALEANKILESVAKSNKKSSGIHALIGLAYLKSKVPNATKAIEFLIKSRDLDPKVASTWSHLGDAYRLSGDNGSAMTAYETSVEKDKNNIPAYMSMAEIWSRSRQMDLAIQKVEQALTLDSEYAPAWKLLVELYSKIKNWDKVTKSLDKYTSLVGSDEAAKVRLVKFLVFQAKDFERAIKQGEELKKTSKDYTLNRWLAWAYGETEKYEESYQASKQLFEDLAKDEKRKSFPSDYEYLAKACLKTKRLDEANAVYQKIFETDPSKKEDVYNMFIAMYKEENNNEKLIEYYNLKNGVKPLNTTDNYYLALAYQKVNKLAESDAIFVRILESNPTYTAGWLNRAKIAMKMDPDTKTFAAHPFFVKYVEHAMVDKDKNKKNLIEAFRYLGFYEVQNNNLDAALANYDQILSLDPSDTDAINNKTAILGNKK
ncbi:MAG: hypothetical protein RLZZ546_609 [Bacteroidota bacterium]